MLGALGFGVVATHAVLSGPAGATALYWALYRYYRNTDKSHAFERETKVDAKPVTGADRKIDNGVVFMTAGKISSVGGPETAIPAGVNCAQGTAGRPCPGV